MKMSNYSDADIELVFSRPEEAPVPSELSVATFSASLLSYVPLGWMVKVDEEDGLSEVLGLCRQLSDAALAMARARELSSQKIVNLVAYCRRFASLDMTLAVTREVTRTYSHLFKGYRDRALSEEMPGGEEVRRAFVSSLLNGDMIYANNRNAVFLAVDMAIGIDRSNLSVPFATQMMAKQIYEWFRCLKYSDVSERECAEYVMDFDEEYRMYRAPEIPARLRAGVYASLAMSGDVKPESLFESARAALVSEQPMFAECHSAM